MKKIIVLLIVFSFVFPVLAQAQIQEKELNEKKQATAKENIEAGVLPNSFWYWVDIFGEDLKFFFSVGKEKKVKFLQNDAQERLLEMQKLNVSGVLKYNDKLMMANERKIARAMDLQQKKKAPVLTDQAALTTKAQKKDKGFFSNIKAKVSKLWQDLKN